MSSDCEKIPQLNTVQGLVGSQIVKSNRLSNYTKLASSLTHHQNTYLNIDLVQLHQSNRSPQTLPPPMTKDQL